MIEFIADKKGKLTKLALIKSEDLSFSSLQKLLRNKDVKVNGKRVGRDILLEVGDSVQIYYSPKVTNKYSTIFVDQNVLIINKFKGYSSERVFDAVQLEYPTAFFIHRLDRNTDGIMVFALNQTANQELLKGFKERTFIKEYLATVYGVPKQSQQTLTAHLLKDAERSMVTIYDKPVKGSSPIKTGYEVIERYADSSLLKVTLYTGKTHQIRAHLAHIGHFILGDGKYGDNQINQQKGVKKQMLSAYSLTLNFDDNSPLAYLNGKKFCLREID